MRLQVADRTSGVACPLRCSLQLSQFRFIQTLRRHGNTGTQPLQALVFLRIKDNEFGAPVIGDGHGQTLRQRGIATVFLLKFTRCNPKTSSGQDLDGQRPEKTNAIAFRGIVLRCPDYDAAICTSSMSMPNERR